MSPVFHHCQSVNVHKTLPPSHLELNFPNSLPTLARVCHGPLILKTTFSLSQISLRKSLDSAVTSRTSSKFQENQFSFLNIFETSSFSSLKRMCLGNVQMSQWDFLYLSASWCFLPFVFQVRDEVFLLPWIVCFQTGVRFPTFQLSCWYVVFLEDPVFRITYFCGIASLFCVRSSYYDCSLLTLLSFPLSGVGINPPLPPHLACHFSHIIYQVDFLISPFLKWPSFIFLCQCCFWSPPLISISPSYSRLLYALSGLQLPSYTIIS